MSNYSLLFARDLQDADDSAVIDWGWQRYDELYVEYRRPDNNERVRFLHDMPGTMGGLRWNTNVYLGRNWKQRRDASQIMGCLDSGMFKEVDPTLPPPRPRRSRDKEELSLMRRMIDRLESR